ncbi:MAG: hypothetical protein R2729_30100 [Bryobacteraceae bacterium]
MPAQTIATVVSAASGTAPICAGSQASVFGTNLPVPAGPVTVAGKAAHIYFASAGQYNIQIPVDAGVGAATITVGASAPFAITLTAFCPALFSITANGSGLVSATHQDSSLVTGLHPASPGEAIQLVATGFGATSPPVGTGAAAPFSPLATTVQPPTVTIGGQAATVLFSGLLPGAIGFIQLNVTVPPVLGAGLHNVQVTIGGAVSNMAPLPVGAALGATPAAGNLLSQVFSFTFFHAQGASKLNVLNVLINNAVDGRNACYLAFVVSSGSLFLVNDSGDAGGPYAGSMVLPGSGSIANSQCTVNGSGSSVAVSGNTLTLTLNISFAPSFAGSRLLYMAARDNDANPGVNNTGWHANGAWQVPGSPLTPARVSSISPARATSRTVSLTGVFTDNAGFAALSVLNILINNAIDGRGACYIAFVVSDGSLFLVNDAGDGGGPFAGSLIIPGAGSAANSQCTVSGAGSSVVKSGNTVTLTLNVTFSPSFAGDRVVYAAARDNLSNNSGWQALATIAVP